MEVYFWIFASVIVLSALGRLYLFIKGGNRVQIYELFESLIAILRLQRSARCLIRTLSVKER